ncbi:hypothetical protein BH11VER1_BH11VER1_07950 [soil metagenome]
MNESRNPTRAVLRRLLGGSRGFLAQAAALSGFALLFCLSSCASTGTFFSSEKETLGKLMVERLEWMDEVARVKKARSLPVNDPVREAQLLDAMGKLASASNLPVESVRDFFSGQIVAAKERQEECLKHGLASKQQQAPVPDLANTIRPALDRIGKRMMSALAVVRASEDPERVIVAARLRLQKAGYSNAVVAPAIQGLEAGLREK